MGWVVKKAWNAPVPESVSMVKIYVFCWRSIMLRDQDVDTTVEALYLTLMDFVLVGTITVGAGWLFAQISAMTVSQVEFDKKMNSLREFAHAGKGLPKPLQSKMSLFYKYLYEHKTVFDEKQILSELPIHMRRDVVKYRYGGLIENSFFFVLM